MATISQLPGKLNLDLVRGDEFATLVDFSINVTGYTFSASVYSTITGSTVITPTVSVVSAATGQVNVGISEAQSEAVAPGTYLWRLSWVAPGSATRTALEGVCEVIA
jgi:hypothetical protein